jgi:hypothetical protein
MENQPYDEELFTRKSLKKWKIRKKIIYYLLL